MDAVSNINQVMLILRQKLQERACRPSTSARDVQGQTAVRTENLDPHSHIAALSRQEGLDEQHLARLFIESLLNQEFGSVLVNDAQFQQVITRVVQVIEGDVTLSGTLLQTIKQIKVNAQDKQSKR
jgi:hypothetical protein